MSIPVIFKVCYRVSLGKRTTTYHWDETVVNLIFVVLMILLLVDAHTVQVNLPVTTATISGGGLSGQYVLEQFHHHWGRDDTEGSEHLVDGKVHPLEVRHAHSRHAQARPHCFSLKFSF